MLGEMADAALTGQDLRSTAEQASDGIRSLLALIDAGEVEATPARTWHLRGALDALEALLDGRPVESTVGR
jgi:hypothetical protein